MDLINPIMNYEFGQVTVTFLSENAREKSCQIKINRKIENQINLSDCLGCTIFKETKRNFIKRTWRFDLWHKLYILKESSTTMYILKNRVQIAHFGWNPLKGGFWEKQLYSAQISIRLRGGLFESRGKYRRLAKDFISKRTHCYKTTQRLPKVQFRRTLLCNSLPWIAIGWKHVNQKYIA